MKLSSGARRFEALSIAQHGEQDSHPSPGQGDHGLVVPPALTPLALLEGAGVRSAQAGEGGLVEDSLEHLLPPLMRRWLPTLLPESLATGTRPA